MALPPTQCHFGIISIFNRGDNRAFCLNKSHNLNVWICLKFNRWFQYHVMSGSAASKDGQSRNGKEARFGTFWICLTLIFCGVHSTQEFALHFLKYLQYIPIISIKRYPSASCSPLLEDAEVSVWKRPDPQPRKSTFKPTHFIGRASSCFQHKQSLVIFGIITA